MSNGTLQTRRPGGGAMARVPVRLGLFALGLVAAFGAAAAVGKAIHPGGPAPAREHMGPMSPAGHSTGAVVSDGTFTLAPVTFGASAGEPTTLSFTILDRDGRVVRDGYELEAERRLHLIIARRDLVGFQHLHPTEAADGTWSTRLTVPAPGVYRVLADFQVDGDKHVLAGDLTVAGAYAPAPLPPPAASVAVDGFIVTLAHPVLRAGEDAHLTFTVTRDGRPVAALEPYLGARGHLVALREGDLAYLHVHPGEEDEPAGVVPFAAELPSLGRYRLFLQFQVAGVVHTAPLTVEVQA